jgi:hypothetical protein
MPSSWISDVLGNPALATIARVKTTYPGQAAVTIEAPPHIVEHYLHRDWDLPFVEPVGHLKDLVDRRRRGLRPSSVETTATEAGFGPLGMRPFRS